MSWLRIFLFCSLQLCALLTSALPIIQSYSDNERTFISIVVPKDQEINVQVIAKNASTPVAVIELVKQIEIDQSRILQWEISGLNHQEVYDFEVYSVASNKSKNQKKKASSQLLDRREFSSLDTDKKNPKIAVMSCSNQNFDLGVSMMRTLNAVAPDAIFHLGDFYYIDTGLQAVLHLKPNQRQTEKRVIDAVQHIGLFHQKRLTPVFTVWSDHDFGFNNADTNNPLKELNHKIFRTLFGIPNESKNSNYSRGPGVSFAFQAWGYQFLMLDSMTYQELPNSYLGAEQEKWLEANLENSPERPTFVMDGFPLFSPHKNFGLNEVARGHFDKISGIVQRFPRPYVFVGGDSHYSNVLQIPDEVVGRPSFQLTSSSLHSYRAWMTPPFGVGSFPGPAQRAFTAKHNFLLLQPSQNNESLNFQVTSLGRPKILNQIRYLWGDGVLRPQTYFDLHLSIPKQTSTKNLSCHKLYQN